MNRNVRIRLLTLLRSCGLNLTRESRDIYSTRCPSCGGRLEVHLGAASPDLALCCRGRVEIRVVGQESPDVH